MTQWPIKKKLRPFLSIKRVNTDQESFDHQLPYKISRLSSTKISSNSTTNVNCRTCKQPVRPRQEVSNVMGVKNGTTEPAILVCNNYKQVLQLLLPPVYLNI